MMLWIVAATASLVLVLVWSLLEWKFALDSGGATPAKPDVANLLSKVGFFLVLMVAFHAAIDPDHDKHTFQVHGPQIARALYAFAATLALLVAFPTLRILSGTAVMTLAVTSVEVLQTTAILPGHFRVLDWASALCGVAIAAGPMWLGARRAREAVARELAVKGASARRDKSLDAPI